MKLDGQYQQEVLQNELRLPAGSTWVAYTDQVSHAATAGQHAFEQTFYVPIGAMVDELKAPLRILERLTGDTWSEWIATDVTARGRHTQRGGFSFLIIFPFMIVTDVAIDGRLGASLEPMYQGAQPLI